MSAKRQGVDMNGLFSYVGQIGRLRYLAIAFGYGFLLKIIDAILKTGFTTALAYDTATVISIVLLLLGTYVFIVSTAKRARDMGWHAWTSILVLIPLTIVIFIFYPGKK